MTPIYLDYNASTPIDERVFEKMHPYFCQEYGNPSSNHVRGWTAQKAIEHARSQVANLMGSHPRDVIFTSGATESTSLAILGVFYDQLLNKKKLNPHFITTDVEHACVAETMKLIQKLGADVTVLPTKPFGQLSEEQLRAALRMNTVLVSVIWVNNEIGTINPVTRLAAVAKEVNALFHTDATQGAGKLPFHFSDSQIDLVSFSGHKMYGPKGVGALLRRHRGPKVDLVSLMTGGGQEQTLRSGTQNVPAIVGLGEACELCQNHMMTDAERVNGLGQQLMSGLRQCFPDLILNGHPKDRSVFNYNVTFPSLNLDLAANSLLKVCYSRGSACHSNDPSRTDVLESLGVSASLAGRSLRLSMGRMTTANEVQQVIETFKQIATQTQVSGGARSTPNDTVVLR